MDDTRQRTHPPTTAIILAAGLGVRLQPFYSDGPKGLIPMGGEPILARSLCQLRMHGITDIVIVVGYAAGRFHSFARSYNDVRLIDNPAYATAGSMASLACALEVVDTDFLLLESDLVYESRALAVLVGHDTGDVVLASGPTGATDEVWVEAAGGLLRGLSKDRTRLGSVVGEFTGITRISRRLGAHLRQVCRDLTQSGGAAASYETDALVAAACTMPIAVTVVPDLLWGEIDDAFQFARVRDQVFPAILRRETGR